MNKIWIAIVLFAGVCGVCIWESCYLKKFTSDISVDIALLERQYSQEQYDKAEETAQQIEKKWVKGENVLCHFISNATLYDIGVSVAKLPYLAGREHDEFYTEYREVQVLLRHMNNRERMTVY